MTDLRLRPAELSDVDVLVALARQARAEQQTFRGGDRIVAPENDDQLKARFMAAISAMNDEPINRDLRQHMVWIALFADVVCGYLCAERNDDAQKRSIVTITELFTDTEFRSIGAGEGLVSAALAWAVAIEADSIDAFALPGARETKNLFERMGLTARLITVAKDLSEKD